MENTIKKYLNGSVIAEEELLDIIMESYNYSLTEHEAIMLLHKKYGKPEIF